MARPRRCGREGRSIRACHLTMGLLIGGLMGLMPSEALDAQVIRGRLLDDASAQPIEGATVWLLNEGEVRLVRTLTDAEGRFHFGLELGIYLLYAERIGYLPTTSSPFPVEALDTTDVEFRISDQPILIAPIAVSIGGPSAPRFLRLEWPGAGVCSSRRRWSIH